MEVTISTINEAAFQVVLAQGRKGLSDVQLFNARNKVADKLTLMFNRKELSADGIETIFQGDMSPLGGRTLVPKIYT